MWYKIVTPETHDTTRGYRKRTEQVLYIWGEDSIKVLNIYKRMREVRRSQLPLSIKVLTPEESSILEKAIVEDRKWNIEKAKSSVVRYNKKGKEAPPV